MHIGLAATIASAAVVVSVAVAVATLACFKMFRRYRIPLCGWCSCRFADDQELGPAQARVTDAESPKEVAPPPPLAARRFEWSEVECLTGKFDPAAVVGEGGSSTVYLARLRDSSLAALKLHRPSQRLHRAFRQELDLLLRLRHPHIVRLLGYCDDREEEGVLVFEYVPNGSLHEKLHGGGREALPWARRMAIAYQLAQALDYLHEGCDPQVVHGDVKAANVLLDEEMEAKLCDFGSARVGFSEAVAPSPRRRSSRNMVVGSLGYVDPHYLRSGMVSKKSDVYSFGVLLLELVTGREAFDAERERRLTAELSPVLQDAEARAGEAVDAGLCGGYDASEAKAALAVVAMCVGDNPGLRPSMADVVRLLREKASDSIAGLAATCDGKSGL